jgi:hypothetical protein
MENGLFQKKNAKWDKQSCLVELMDVHSRSCYIFIFFVTMDVLHLCCLFYFKIRGPFYKENY